MPILLCRIYTVAFKAHKSYMLTLRFSSVIIRKEMNLPMKSQFPKILNNTFMKKIINRFALLTVLRRYYLVQKFIQFFR